MKRRDPNQRERVTAQARPVTRIVSPAEIEAYLVATGYRAVLGRSGIPLRFRKGGGAAAMVIPSPRDERYLLSVIVEAIAALERRSPGSTLRDIAAHTRGQ